MIGQELRLIRTSNFRGNVSGFVVLPRGRSSISSGNRTDEQQKFDQAIRFCDMLRGRWAGAMDHYYDAWVERCWEMKRQTLPDDWDGVYRATSK